MMNEINPLIWPSAGGIGVLDPVTWGQTVQIAKQAGIIKTDPSTSAYDTTIVAEALAGITDDAKGDELHQGHRRGDRRRQLASRSIPARRERPVPRGAGRSDSVPVRPPARGSVALEVRDRDHALRARVAVRDELHAPAGSPAARRTSP